MRNAGSLLATCRQLIRCMTSFNYGIKEALELIRTSEFLTELF